MIHEIPRAFRDFRLTPQVNNKITQTFYNKFAEINYDFVNTPPSTECSVK